MIARMWTGWTTPADAEAYERFVHAHVFPHLQTIDGYQGGYILRHDAAEEIEFVVLTLFASLDAVRAFAGPDATVAVIEPEARRLLSRVEPRARHYTVTAVP